MKLSCSLLTHYTNIAFKMAQFLALQKRKQGMIYACNFDGHPNSIVRLNAALNSYIEVMFPTRHMIVNGDVQIQPGQTQDCRIYSGHRNGYKQELRGLMGGAPLHSQNEYDGKRDRDLAATKHSTRIQREEHQSPSKMGNCSISTHQL